MFDKYINDHVIDLYPHRKWEYKGYKFECTGVEKYLFQTSYKILIIDEDGKYHTLRHRSNRLRISEMYDKFIQYCKMGEIYNNFSKQ